MNIQLDLLSELKPTSQLPIIDPNELIGFQFVHENPNGVPVRTAVKRYDDNTGLYHVIQGEDDENWLTESVIQEALLSRSDDGASGWIVKSIQDHQMDGSKVTVQVEWDNGAHTWEPIQLIKKEDPIKLAMYAKEKGLIYKPGWRWARKIVKTPKRLSKMMKIMAAQVSNNARYKFGIKVPKNVQDALCIDHKNGNMLWHNAIQDEIKQLLDFNTFRILPKGETTFEHMDDYTFVPLHFVFDIKFDLRRKARCVAGGNWTAPADVDVFSGVVATESVQIGLYAAVHNALQICAADVGSAFLHGYTKELVYTKAGKEWGPLAGCIMIVVQSIYGLKTSAARFHEVLAKSLYKLGFIPSQADSDLWIKDCVTHYEYISTYVDDLLIMSRNPMSYICLLEKEYPLKGVGKPEYYLGGDIKTFKKADGTIGVATSAKTYIKRVCDKIETLMDWKLRNYGLPMEAEFHPELDVSKLLNSDKTSQYRMMIGSLNWMVTLGQFDVHYATQTMAQYGMAPRKGHIEALKRVFGYMKFHSGAMQIEYNATYPTYMEFESMHYDWFEQYGRCEEELSSNMPVQKGNTVRITAFFDADHAGCLATRRSTTGMLMFLNNTPIKWYSKRQSTVKSATYGSEMVAGQITVEFVIEMQFKLQILGIPIKRSCVLFGDNMSMILNTTIPSSTLKKKHNAIGYHRVREAVAAGINNFIHVPSIANIADILTKPLGPQVYSRLLRKASFPSTGQKTTHKGECQDIIINDGSQTRPGIVITNWEAEVTGTGQKLDGAVLIV